MEAIVHRLSGPLTIYEVAGLKDEVLKILEETPGLILDCSEASRCDTAFVQMLCALSRTCVKRGLSFSLISGPELSAAAMRIGLDLSEEIPVSGGEA